MVAGSFANFTVAYWGSQTKRSSQNIALSSGLALKGVSAGHYKTVVGSLRKEWRISYPPFSRDRPVLATNWRPTAGSKTNNWILWIISVVSWTFYDFFFLVKQHLMYIFRFLGSPN